MKDKTDVGFQCTRIDLVITAAGAAAGAGATAGAAGAAGAAAPN